MDAAPGVAAATPGRERLTDRFGPTALGDQGDKDKQQEALCSGGLT